MRKVTRPWYFYYLRAAISKIWRWSPARKAVLAKSVVGTGKKCKKCQIVIKPQTLKKRTFSGVEVDHIIPVVDPLHGQTSWDEYITKKLGATEADLQVLCVSCHDKKSGAENKIRRSAA